MRSLCGIFDVSTKHVEKGKNHDVNKMWYNVIIFACHQFIDVDGPWSILLFAVFINF